MIVYKFELFVLFFPGACPATFNSLDCLGSFLLNTLGFCSICERYFKVSKAVASRLAALLLPCSQSCCSNTVLFCSLSFFQTPEAEYWSISAQI